LATSAIDNRTVKNTGLIVVSTRWTALSTLDTDAGTPGIVSVLETITGIPTDAATGNPNENMQVVLDMLARATWDARNALGSTIQRGIAFIVSIFDHRHGQNSDPYSERTRRLQYSTAVCLNRRRRAGSEADLLHALSGIWYHTVIYLKPPCCSNFVLVRWARYAPVTAIPGMGTLLHRRILSVSQVFSPRQDTQ
jgi:hypothetical protein